MLSLLDEAVSNGCRFFMACRETGLHPRTVQRWRAFPDGGEDRRRGPLTSPRQKLDESERAAIIETANSEEFRNVSPKQIVPQRVIPEIDGRFPGGLRPAFRVDVIGGVGNSRAMSAPLLLEVPWEA